MARYGKKLKEERTWEGMQKVVQAAKPRKQASNEADEQSGVSSLVGLCDVVFCSQCLAEEIVNSILDSNLRVLDVQTTRTCQLFQLISQQTDYENLLDILVDQLADLTAMSECKQLRRTTDINLVTNQFSPFKHVMQYLTNKEEELQSARVPCHTSRLLLVWNRPPSMNQLSF